MARKRKRKKSLKFMFRKNQAKQVERIQKKDIYGIRRQTKLFQTKECQVYFEIDQKESYIKKCKHRSRKTAKDFRRNENCQLTPFHAAR